MKPFELADELWYVPKWTLPVWKVSEVELSSPEGAIALESAIRLQQANDPLFVSGVANFLLSRLSQEYEATVAEAQAARGDRISTDLQELVRKRRGLKNLPLILDAMARYPDLDSLALSDLLDIELYDAFVPTPARLNGPWKKHALPADTRPTDPYLEMTYWLPEPDPPIRVYIGEQLAKELVAGETLTPAGRELVEEVRDWLWRRHGVLLPGVTFYNLDTDSGQNAFRIEVLDQTRVHNDAQPIVFSTGDGTAALASELRWRAETLRQRWITAETTRDVLRELNPELKEWIEARYSLTDIKRIQRLLIAPGEAEFLADPVEFGIDESPPRDRSLHDKEAVLRSLVFWDIMGDIYDVSFLLDSLRATQQHLRMVQAQPQDRGGAAARPALNGVRELLSGDLSSASGSFSDASRISATNATAAFLDLYSALVRDDRRRQILEACTSPPYQPLSPEERFELDDMRAAVEDDADNGGRAHRLALCALAQRPESTRPRARQEAIAHLISKHRDLEAYSVEEAQWLAFEIVQTFDPVRHHPEQITFTEELFARILPEAEHTFSDLVDICQARGPRRWCFDLLAALAERTHASSPEIGLIALVALVNRERAQDIARGLNLASSLAAALERNPELKDTAWPWLTEAIELWRAAGQVKLHIIDYKRGEQDSAVRASVGPIFERLATSEEQFVSYYAYYFLVKLLQREGKLQDALETLDQALARTFANLQWKDDYYKNLKVIKLNLLLEIGKIGEALENTRELKEQFPEEEDFHFTQAMLATLTCAPDWETTAREFLLTDHEFVPYIAVMMFGSRLLYTGRDIAETALRRHWRQIKPSDWPARLQSGDPDVWREMLLGYALEEEVDRLDVFGPLESEAAFARSHFAALPLPHAAMLTEALFYEALLARGRGDDEGMLENLKRIVELGYVFYNEYSMAHYLLQEACVATGETLSP
jgi:tetratricopeptide (TPR) repeat protein